MSDDKNERKSATHLLRRDLFRPALPWASAPRCGRRTRMPHRTPATQRHRARGLSSS